MDDILNVILIHTNYFKNILISEDSSLFINLLLLNRNYNKSINNVYKNYIFGEFPEFKKFDNLSFTRFGCSSWIHLYRYVFTCPLREIIFKNIDYKSEILLQLGGSFYLVGISCECYLIPMNQVKNGIQKSSPNDLPVNFNKIKREINDFLNLKEVLEILEDDGIERTIPSLFSFVAEMISSTNENFFENEEISKNFSFYNFLKRICLIYNQKLSYDVISSLLKDKKLIINNSIHIIF